MMVTAGTTLAPKLNVFTRSTTGIAADDNAARLRRGRLRLGKRRFRSRHQKDDAEKK
jgi:hypothetical protein